jgi:hypothetical protein
MTQKEASVAKALQNKTKNDENSLDGKTSFVLTLLLLITTILVLGAGYYHFCVK